MVGERIDDGGRIVKAVAAEPTPRETRPGSLAEFRNCHAGAAIVVCGCGESLAHLTAPERFITIGVNDVGRLFQPDYLVVVNSRHQFSGNRFVHVEQSRARVLFTQLDLKVPHPRVVRFALGRRGGTDLKNPNVLHYTQNSPYVALCLALHMGATRIGLVGVDFTDHHFFGRTGRHPLAHTLQQIDTEYARLYQVCQRMGVEVFNLSAPSRLTAFPKLDVDHFDRLARPSRGLNVVSYATTPVAGVPAILARAITARTSSSGRCVWAQSGYGNGVAFQGDVQYTTAPEQARDLLSDADVIVAHNGKVDRQHQALVDGKPVVTLAHNYMWNVDRRFVERGFPGLVVGQYQATLPEFAGWTPVPNPIPLWEPSHQPGVKEPPIGICFVPSGKHERFPPGHRLYWHSKGYRTTLGVLERLEAVRLEVIRRQQVSHEESLAMKRRSLIVIDECVTGSYHRNSLEGLATGCVVINAVGTLPGVVDVLRACAGGAPDIPFVSSRLDDLDGVLRRLVARGPEYLAEEGRRNRRWMEEHWDFGSQWDRFWMPAIDRAMAHAGRRARAPRAAPADVPLMPAAPVASTAVSTAARVERTPAPAPAAPRPMLSDLTIVVPFGGQERLRNLLATLEPLRNTPLAGIVVVESAPEPSTVLAEDTGIRYVFMPAEGPFHKARVMNVGAAFVTGGVFAWLDADLRVSTSLFEAALDEMTRRRLDCLVPWTSVRYLGEDDTDAVAAGLRDPSACEPVTVRFTRHGSRGGLILVRTELVKRWGGVCEDFQGWGGEDTAFFHKASLFGRAAATSRNDQHLYHLFHRHTGAVDPGATFAANPHYARNRALVQEVQRFGSRERFLSRFSPSDHPPAPWRGVKRVACRAGALPLAKALSDLYGPAIVLCDEHETPDAMLHRPVEAVPDLAPTLEEVLQTAARLALPPNLRTPQQAAEPIAPPAAVSAPADAHSGEPDAPRTAEPRRVNLGCCDAPAAGFLNVDRAPGPGVDRLVDLTLAWPWTESSLDEIRAWDIIEHLPDKLHTMNEMWRVLRPGGRAEIIVPTTDGPGAFQDPTHVSFWNRRSFLYYESGNPYRERFAASYGIRAAFRIVRERIDRTADGPKLTILLECVKP